MYKCSICSPNIGKVDIEAPAGGQKPAAVHNTECMITTHVIRVEKSTYHA